MGVNMAGYGIIDDEVTKEASKQEIIRRYYNTLCQIRQGTADNEQKLKLELLMKQAGTSIEDRLSAQPRSKQRQRAIRQQRSSLRTAASLQERQVSF